MQKSKRYLPFAWGERLCTVHVCWSREFVRSRPNCSASFKSLSARSRVSSNRRKIPMLSTFPFPPLPGRCQVMVESILFMRCGVTAPADKQPELDFAPQRLHGSHLQDASGRTARLGHACCSAVSVQDFHLLYCNSLVQSGIELEH